MEHSDLRMTVKGNAIFFQILRTISDVLAYQHSQLIKPNSKRDEFSLKFKLSYNFIDSTMEASIISDMKEQIGPPQMASL